MLSSDISQFKKGVLRILILKSLSQNQKYGYELLSEIDKNSNGFFKLKEGTLYPILYKLEEHGFVVSQWQLPDERGKAKKYYYITASGRQELKELIHFWELLSLNVTNFLETGDAQTYEPGTDH